MSRTPDLRSARRDDLIVCIGSGPSLTPHDCNFVADQVVNPFIIAVNDAWRWAPWADVLYAADAQWWRWHACEIGAMPTRRYSLQREAREIDPTIEILNYNGQHGIEWSIGTLRTGGHSGYQAINLAAQARPKRIVLLGYDMMPSAKGQNHFFGEHPNGNAINYDDKLRYYEPLAALLAERGVEIVNATRETAIPDAWIPREPLTSALTRPFHVAA